MKNIFILASLAAIIVASEGMASQRVVPHVVSTHEVPVRGLRIPAVTGSSNAVDANTELQQLAARNLLGQPVKGQTGKAEADAAVKGTEFQKEHIAFLHNALPKDHATGTAYIQVVNALNTRAELFKDISGRYDQAQRKYPGSYEKLLAENMAALKQSQGVYVDAIKLKVPQKVGQLNGYLQDMNQALDKQYMALLKAVQ